MPELPEVELVTRALNKAVSGRHIETAELLRPRLAPHVTADEFAAKLENCRINFVHRRGKNILFDLNNGRTLLTHLRMSGTFMLLPADADDPKFTHAVFQLKDGFRLVFQDQRHFGLMKIVDTPRLNEDGSISKLAPEPFSEEFTVEYLKENLKRSTRTLKEFLLDQTKVCGLGNIYASEAMFRTGLSPKRKARNVPRAKVETLFGHIKGVLNDALTYLGTRDPHPIIIGEGVYGGDTEADWHVYDREDDPCRNCKTPIRRIRQGARSTYYCPTCQR